VIVVLDSLLTLKKGAAAWMAGFFLVCVIANRTVSALTGREESVFLLLALMILAAFLVTGTYTAGKWIVCAVRGRRRDDTPPQ
jgi:hypothetical protein